MFLLFLLFSFPSLYFVYISWCDVFSYGGTLFKSSAASSWGDRTPTRAHQHALSCITTKHVGIHHTASHSQTQNSTIYRLIIAVYLSWLIRYYSLNWGRFLPANEKVISKSYSSIFYWSMITSFIWSYFILKLNTTEHFRIL